MQDSDLQELQTRMVGKTVVSVSPPGADEAICKFTMSDGTAFRLHATELGYWVEDTVGKDELYSDLKALLVDACHFSYDNKDHLVASVEGDSLKIDIDGIFLEGDITKFSPWEQKVCRHPQGPSLLAVAATMGGFWETVFSASDCECPPELVKPS
jgi:hypothetical protein